MTLPSGWSVATAPACEGDAGTCTAMVRKLDRVDSIRDRLRGLIALAGTPPEFDVLAVPDDPAELFGQWFDSALAVGQLEPHAVTLSTIGLDGIPDARVLILKDVTSEGWWFASSADSAKGRQLEASPLAALTFYWPSVSRSVRIRGLVSRATADQSANDFARRGLGARSVALCGPQSSRLDDPDRVATAVQAASEALSAEPNLVSESWALWCVKPLSIEFWQADRERRHQRVRYQRPTGDSPVATAQWERLLLWP